MSFQMSYHNKSIHSRFCSVSPEARCRRVSAEHQQRCKHRCLWEDNGAPGVTNQQFVGSVVGWYVHVWSCMIMYVKAINEYRIGVPNPQLAVHSSLSDSFNGKQYGLIYPLRLDADQPCSQLHLAEVAKRNLGPGCDYLREFASDMYSPAPTALDPESTKKVPEIKEKISEISRSTVETKDLQLMKDIGTKQRQPWFYPFEILVFNNQTHLFSCWYLWCVYILVGPIAAWVHHQALGGAFVPDRGWCETQWSYWCSKPTGSAPLGGHLAISKI